MDSFALPNSDPVALIFAKIKKKPKHKKTFLSFHSMHEVNFEGKISTFLKVEVWLGIP